MYERWVTAGVRRALEDTPVVLLVGPRRSGKTTLVRSLEGEDLTYHTLDDPTTKDFAASDPVTPSDFSGLRILAEGSGDRFVRGVVLYDGDTVVPVGERLAAVPLSCLWGDPPSVPSS